MLSFLLLIFGLPWLSPRGFVVEGFRGTFNYVIFIVVALLGYIHGISLQAALRPEMDSGRMLISGLFLFPWR